MRSKLRIPRTAWTLIHLSLLGWAAWIAAGVVDSIVADRVSVSGAPFRASAPEPSASFASLEPKLDFSHIIRRNIFNSSREPGESKISHGSEVSSETFKKPSEPPRTRLGLRLLGTVTDESGEGRFAVIEIEKERKQRIYTINDTVLGATIIGIDRNRALLRRGGMTEVLEVDFSEKTATARGAAKKAHAPGLSSGADIVRVAEGEYRLSKRYLESQIQNMNRLLTQVRAIPNIGKDGVADGFKLFAIKKGSIFDKIGFRNHDVIKRVNGIDLDSAEKGLELFQALRNETDFEIDLMRQSKKTSLRFTVQ